MTLCQQQLHFVTYNFFSLNISNMWRKWTNWTVLFGSCNPYMSHLVVYFKIIWLSNILILTYLMKVIPETHRVYYILISTILLTTFVTTFLPTNICLSSTLKQYSVSCLVCSKSRPDLDFRQLPKLCFGTRLLRVCVVNVGMAYFTC